MGFVAILLLVALAVLWLTRKPGKPNAATWPSQDEIESIRRDIETVKAASSATPQPPAAATQQNPPPYDYYAPVDGFSRRVEAYLHLRYLKTSGAINERDYDVQSFMRGPDGYAVQGYCHLRQARRSLVTQGVLACTDRTTGEIIDNLPDYLDLLYAKTPRARLDAVLESHHAPLTVLFYFAKADGAMRAKERGIIVDYIVSAMAPGGPPIADIEAEIRGWHPPGRGAFWDAVTKVSETSADQLAQLLALVEQMAASDKTIHAEETRALNYMRKKLH